MRTSERLSVAGMLFWDVASEIKVSLCAMFRNKGTKTKTKTKGAAYFFPWRHEVLVGFEDVCQGLLDVSLLHAGQYGGRQEQRKTPFLSVEGRLVQMASLKRPNV